MTEDILLDTQELNMKIILLSLIVFLSSCQSDKLPEDVLKSYVNYRFSKNQAKDEALSKTTGRIHGYIDSMSEVEFEQFSKEMINFKKKKFKVNLKSCKSEKQCFITYTLTYGYEGFELDEVEEGKENAFKVVGKVEESYKKGEQRVFSLVRSGERVENGIEVKKIAELSRLSKDEQWKIAKVSNIKTYIENKEEVMVNPSNK
jgi:hypothetical protein